MLSEKQGSYLGEWKVPPPGQEPGKLPGAHKFLGLQHAEGVASPTPSLGSAEGQSESERELACTGPRLQQLEAGQQ